MGNEDILCKRNGFSSVNSIVVAFYPCGIDFEVCKAEESVIMLCCTVSEFFNFHFLNKPLLPL